jgi:formylglycine-generating enzyme required for sulfatase activity
MDNPEVVGKFKLGRFPKNLTGADVCRWLDLCPEIEKFVNDRASATRRAKAEALAPRDPRLGLSWGEIGDKRDEQKLEEFVQAAAAFRACVIRKNMAYITGFKNDVFVSYSHLDNSEGWVTEFHQHLQDRLSAVLGSREVAVWRDKKKLGGLDLMDKEIVDQLSSAAMLVCVVSPGAINSGWCQKEWSKFQEFAKTNGGFRIKNKIRAAKVVKTPLDEDAHRSLFGTLGFEFYKREGRFPREFQPGDPEFIKKLNEVAWDIKWVLDELKSIRFAPPPTQPSQECPKDMIPDGRVLDAAIARRTVCGKATPLLAMIRLPDSEGLKAIIESDDLYSQADLAEQLTARAIKSRQFAGLRFIVDKGGKLRPAEVLLVVRCSDFKEGREERKLLVPPNRDSEVCSFLLTPEKLGDLWVNLQVLQNGVLLGSRDIQTRAYATQQGQVYRVLVELPIQVEVHGPQRADAASGRTAAETMAAQQRPATRSKGEGVARDTASVSAAQSASDQPAHESARVLRVVVAWPKDVQGERNILSATVDEVNQLVGRKRGVRLELWSWDTDAYPGLHIEGPQGQIDSSLHVETCDLFIGIFWKRLGTPTKDAESGAVHEFRRAREAWKVQGQPHIMMYFSEKAYNPLTREEAEQWAGVLDFKKEISREGLYSAYKTKRDFEQQVRRHLTQFVYSDDAQSHSMVGSRIPAAPCGEYAHATRAPIPKHRRGASALILGGTAAAVIVLLAAIYAVYHLWSPFAESTAHGTDKAGLTYSWISSGRYQMGCSDQVSGCPLDQQPPHLVTISRAFWIGTTEATVAAYRKYAQAKGAPIPMGLDGDDHPMASVIWADASMFCQWAGGRLPTEAEWEYAARAGVSGPRYGPLDQIAWFHGNSNGTQKVASKLSNPFGVYDMLGNVAEWTGDWFGQYGWDAVTDPRGPATGTFRVVRGGSYVDPPNSITAWIRRPMAPDATAADVGFRCVLEK